MDIKIKMELTGINAMFDAMIATMPSERNEVVLEAANTLMDWSQMEVPEDTKALRKSAYVDGSKLDGSLFGTCTIGYGGPEDRVNPISGRYASYYAYKVHEDFSVHHDKGKAKYLEDPMNKYGPKILMRLADASYSKWMNNIKIGWRGKGKAPARPRIK